MSKKVYVTLQNGKVFEGYSFGAEKEVIGELVFTTGMTGYIETLTDPSYYGQIVTQAENRLHAQKAVMCKLMKD